MKNLGEKIVKSLSISFKEKKKCSYQHLIDTEGVQAFNLFMPRKEYEYFISVIIWFANEEILVEIKNKSSFLFQGTCKIDDNLDVFLLGCFQNVAKKYS